MNGKDTGTRKHKDREHGEDTVGGGSTMSSEGLLLRQRRPIACRLLWHKPRNCHFQHANISNRFDKGPEH